MGIFRRFINMTRKPEGFLGKMMLRGMNSGHAPMAEWALAHFPSIQPLRLAELGCGGGRNAAMLLRYYPQAALTAIDYSSLSVEMASAYNQKAIAAGRCTVRQGDVSKLEWQQEAVQLATAFETIYFWPELEKCFRQVRRILEEDGYFIIVNELAQRNEAAAKYEGLIDGMHVYTQEEINRALLGAGFRQVRAVHHDHKPWLMMIAQK